MRFEKKKNMPTNVPIRTRFLWRAAFVQDSGPFRCRGSERKSPSRSFLVSRLGGNQDTGDVAAGRAFECDQSWIALDRGDPHHVLHRGLAAWARQGAFSFRQIGHERIRRPHGVERRDRFAGCVDLGTLRFVFLCYGT
jgi:hypothetical protein